MTKYNSKFKDKAYGLFVQGMPLTQIAKELGVNRKTINYWSRRSNWEIRKKIIDKQAGQLRDINLTKIKAEGIQVFQQAIHQFAKKLKDEKIDIKPSDALAIHKHLLHMFEKPKEDEEDENLKLLLDFMGMNFKRYQEK